MKARRFFAFVAGAAMLFGVGCTPDGGKEAGDEAMAEIAVNPSSFATTLEGGEQVIAVTSNATWTVSCDQADVTVEPLTGEGNGSVTITVPAAAAREFKVVFDAQKQTLIPALGTSTTTTAKAEVVVSQNAGGVNQSNFLYYEKVGEDVEKVTLDNGNTAWPYIDQFNGWTPEGDAAANVTYKGQSASVRHSGNAYQPTADAVGVSGAPYVFLNKVPAQAHFVIENIAVTGGSNYIFTYNVSCQNAYNGGTPGFATVDGSLVHLELGYDGQNWDAVDCTFAPNGGNGWYAVQAEFKVKADATVLYARFTYEAPASNGGGRFDDFKLVEGGNGAELAPEAPQQPEAPEKPEGAVTIPYSEPFTTSQGWFTINDVVLGEGLTYAWIFDSQYSCMKASAYKDGAKASESWLISPEITLVGATAPAVSFEHCHKFAGTPANELTLWISEDKGTNWNQLTIPVYGSNNDYTFVANTIDLTSYVGKNVQIAFKYVATSTHAATWEIRNFKVAEGNGSTTEPEQPGQGGGETPDVPASGVYASDAAFVCSADNSTDKCYTLGDSKINGAACSGVKLGTSKNAGFFTSAAVGVEGTKTLSFYGMAWKGASATIYIKVEGSSEVKSVAVKANDGATGNPPFTITVTDADYYSVELTGLTADAKIMFSTDATFSTATSSAARAVLAGITLK